MCEYCSKSKDNAVVVRDRFDFEIQKIRKIYYLCVGNDNVEGYDYVKVKIHHCPHCGRKLGDE